MTAKNKQKGSAVNLGYTSNLFGVQTAHTEIAWTLLKVQ
jgi:hypothetical protein